MVLKTNLLTLFLVLIAIVSTTTAALELINRRDLNRIIDIQNAKISDLIQTKKDLQFSKEVNNDSNLTSIQEIKNMVQGLKDNNNVLGTTAPAVDGTTLPSPLGMLTLNVGVTSINIYDSPSTSANILSSTLPPSVMFYYQKQPGWHQVEYTSNQLGWIADESLTEITP